jgi:hypothetical protein
MKPENKTRALVATFLVLFGVLELQLQCSAPNLGTGDASSARRYGEVITPPGIARVVTTAPATGSGTTINPVSVQTFGTSQAGAVPSSGGGSTNFLRADGSWATPAGTGTPTSRTISTTSPLAGGGDLSANRTLSINANGITDSFLRQAAGVSVIGRSANSTGNVADIVAASDGQVLTRSSGALAFADPSSIVPSVVPYMGLFGDGSDGAIVFDGSTTVTVNGTSFAADVNGRYVLTRDILGTNVTINVGATVVPTAIDNEKQCSTGGSPVAHKIYASGTLTVNGRIRAGGCGAQSLLITGHGTVNGLGGASTFNVTATTSTGGGGSTSGAGGVAGVHTNHVGFTATGSTGGAINTGGTAGAVSFMGGGGGGTSAFAGGAAGGITTVPVANGSVRDLRTLVSGGVFNSTNTLALVMAGSAGGGGAYGNLINANGGGGGGGGGLVGIVAFTVAGSGSIEAPGGDGTAGGVNGTTGGGGGGGGGGGSIVLVYATGTVPTTNVAGGSGGAGGGLTGKNGGGGFAGKTFILH